MGIRPSLLSNHRGSSYSGGNGNSRGGSLSVYNQASSASLPIHPNKYNSFQNNGNNNSNHNNNNNSGSSSSGGGSGPSMPTDSNGRRLTRSALTNTTIHTMFNMPILGRVSTLFDMVDVSRKRIKTQLQVYRASLLRNNNNLVEKQVKSEMKTKLLDCIRLQVCSIMPSLNMRAWRCLLPTARYPLPAPLVRSLDPSTLMGRCLFTPTEDDLLLRGIMLCGEAWEEIMRDFMPSKVAQTLQYRYTQMTSLTASSMEDNNYKRYVHYTMHPMSLFSGIEYNSYKCFHHYPPTS